MKIVALILVALLVVVAPTLAHGPGKGHEGHKGEGNGHDKDPKGPKGPGGPDKPTPSAPAPAPGTSRDTQSISSGDEDAVYSLIAMNIRLATTGAVVNATTSRTVAVFYNRGSCLDEVARLNRTGNPFTYRCIRGLL